MRLGRCYPVAAVTGFRGDVDGHPGEEGALVGLIDAIRSANLFDLIVAIGLGAAFILGFMQGVIRRCLGIIAMLFAFLLSANLRDPVGSFLASNWRQFPNDYSYMLGFGFMFLVFTIAGSLIIQAFYRRVEIFSAHPIVDEVIGGILGVIQGLILVGVGIIILGTFQWGAHFSGEISILRDIWNAVDGSQSYHLCKGTLIPDAFLLIGGLLPSSVVNQYRS